MGGYLGRHQGLVLHKFPWFLVAELWFPLRYLLFQNLMAFFATTKLLHQKV